ncbi:OmpP1/FadL family transporter [Chitinimonas sp. PSY-7]|uniref:outer membrane protein transport protein n=1 Tax=Chitinimonas sp. PSY-7 TaxID=3459088 RepID=UPI0040402C03
MLHDNRLATLLALALFPATAQAGGFALDEQGAAGMGNAWAGAAAATSDSSAVFHNPAALMGLKQSQWLISGNYMDLSAKFRATGSDTWLIDRATGQVGTTSVVGTPTGEVRAVGGGDSDGGRGGLVPAFFYAVPINEQATAGLGVYAPFGSETRFDATWAGRYSGMDTEITALNISPTLAWRINPQLSIGFGLNAIRIDAEASKALDFRYEATIAEAALGQSVPVIDGKATLKGKGWGYGFNLGLLYEMANHAKLAASFRSSVTPKAKGDYRVEIPALYSQLATGLGMSLESEVQAAHAKVKLPWRLQLATDWPVNEDWSIQADITRTGWKRFNELRAQINNTPDQVQVQNWRDTTRVGLGGTWHYADALDWKFGIAWDQTPVRSAQWRHPSTPDADRLWLSTGFAWKYGKANQLDFGLAYTHLSNAQVDYTDTATNRADYPFFAADQKFRVQGNFKLKLWSMGAQYRHSW